MGIDWICIALVMAGRKTVKGSSGLTRLDTSIERQVRGKGFELWCNNDYSVEDAESFWSDFGVVDCGCVLTHDVRGLGVVQSRARNSFLTINRVG